jgi:FkbM family methyltransferase
MGNFIKRSIGYILRQLMLLYEDGLSIENFRYRKNLRGKSINYHRYKIFRKKWLLDSDIQTVLDIGANIGEFTGIFNELFPKAEIHAFEPLPDCFNKLRERTKELKNVKVYNIGLGSKDGELELYKSSWHPASSFREMGDLHKQNYPHSSKSENIIVGIRQLDDIFEGSILPENIFIKMDVQGFEDEVIKGGIKTFSNSRVIVVESSFQKLYENEPMFHGIYSLLEPLGFEYRGSLKQSVNKMDESFLQGDCIFIRNR